jgi:SAM-dependent methyltransferase
MANILNEKFSGVAYRLANNWFSFVKLENYQNKSINYLEIGAFYGANLLSVANTYASHKNSKLFAIDPWQDYDEYPEYKNEQQSIYLKFMENVNNSNLGDKIIPIRGFSSNEVLKFENDFFDIIYIDGNHEPEFVLEDAVVSFRKLKNNGIMIFDDYGWGGPDLTKRGIDSFLNGYYKKIKILGQKETQVFIQKL